MTLQKLHGARRKRIAGDKNNAALHGASAADERLEEGRPVEMRHAEIADHEVVILARKRRQAQLAIEDGFNLMALFAQDIFHQVRDCWLIFDDKNAPQ